MDPSRFLDDLRRHFVGLSPHMTVCDFRVGELSAQSAMLTLPYREDWLGDAESGRLDPGVISVLVDSTAGLAVLAHAGQSEPIATLDLRMDYLRPAFRDAAVHCRASCLRMTRSIAFVRATVWQDDEQSPVASSQLVFMRSGARRAPAGA